MIWIRRAKKSISREIHIKIYQLITIRVSTEISESPKFRETFRSVSVKRFAKFRIISEVSEAGFFREISVGFCNFGRLRNSVVAEICGYEDHFAQFSQFFQHFTVDSAETAIT